MDRKENKMGYMPVNKLLLSISLPIMVSMLVQALYNIVDSIFVARINENALTAVTLAFPIQSLMIAVAVGTGVGVNSLLSRYLGEKEYEKANAVAANGIFLAFVCSLLFVIIGIFVTEPFYISQTRHADPANMLQIREYGNWYLTICCVCSMGAFMQVMFERLIQSTGRSFYTMITQGFGAIVNLILDPILIFGYFGMPKMGVAGAAVATVTGQILAGILAIIFHFTINKEIKITRKLLRPQGRMILEIYKVGLPSIVVQAIGSVMTYGINLILGSFVETAQTVFGIYFKLQSFIFMPVFGLNNGMVPIIAYNYGAGKKDRVIKTIRLSVIYAIGIMLIGLIIMEAFPVQLLHLFDASADMLAIGVPALRTICLSFLFAGFCIVVGSVFQALGNGVYSMIVSIARQLLVLLPVAYLLSLLGKVAYVWWAFPIAEIMSLLMSIFFLVRIYKKVIRHIGEKKTEINSGKSVDSQL